MKRFSIFALAAMMFAACTTDQTADVQPVDAPETLTVSFEEDTRIQLNEAQKTVWTEGDLVSVFYKSDANQKWQFQGETGDRTGTIKRVNAGSATRTMDKVVVVYPYSENYLLNLTTGDIEATLPATQHYLEGSYGLDENIMVSSSYFTQVSLKNVCGWLKLQLTGNGEKVKSITLKGNNGEQVAGLIYVNTENATSILASEMGVADDNENGVGGNLVFEDTIIKEVTLDCGEGVTLGEEATSFYIALPPQTFEKGLTIEVVTAEGKAMGQCTDKQIVIERNSIQPMAALAFEEKIASNQIHYTTSDGVMAWPKNMKAFGAQLMSNSYIEDKGIMTFDAPVTLIGGDAFRMCNSLTSITIPNSVTSIGDAAFYGCSSLTSLAIPDSVTLIGDNVFYDCKSLTSVTIPSSITSIGRGMFSRCSNLTNVTIPDGVTSIGNSAFSYCSSLTSVTIPDSVTSIGDSAFRDCSNLTSITIPDSVTEIGEYAFKNCVSLTSVTIGNSVTSIGDSAFKNCVSLTSVTIGNGVTSIGSGAFSYCDSLTSVTIGNSVTSIGNSTFFGCSSLTSVTIGNSVTSIGNYAFEDCTSLISVTIPDSVTSIGERAFYNCTSLTSVTIGNGVISIGNYAFQSCGSLTSITIPDSVTSIGNYAFELCTSLTSITIPDSVTEIGSRAFYSCSSLTSVTIGNGVTSIGNSTFFGCSSLKAFYGKFASEDNRCLIVNGTLNAFAIGCGATSYTIPDSVTEIGEGAFSNCTSLTSVTIPDSVTSIGSGAFSYCDSLTSVTIGNSVTSIGWCAFYKCTSLKEVYCKPTTPPTGGSYMFSFNASGRRIFVPASEDDSIINAYKAKQWWSDYASSIFEYDFSAEQ